MKKALCTAIVILVLLSFTGTAHAERSVKVMVNGKQVHFTVTPSVTDNRQVIAPAKEVFEALGANVTYDEVSRTVYGRIHEFEIEVTADKWEGRVNGEEVQVGEWPRFIGGQLMIPVKFAAESFGAQYYWDSKTYTAAITERPPLNVRVTDDIKLWGNDDNPIRIMAQQMLADGNLILARLKVSGKDEETVEYALDYFNVGKNMPTEIAAFKIEDFQKEPIFTVLKDGRVLVKTEKVVGRGQERRVRTVIYAVKPETREVQEYFLTDADYYDTLVSSRGEVLYDSHSDTEWDIPRDLYKWDAAGREMKITDTPDIIEEYPQWSPDGSRVAFVEAGKNPYSVLSLSVYNNDDGRTVKIKIAAKNPMDISGPVWSPDSRFLTYFVQENKYLSSLWTVKADGTGLKKIGNIYGSYWPLVWSPDGSELVASSGDGFVVFDKAGKMLTKQKGSDFAWSPDGKILMYKRHREIWLWDPVKNADKPVNVSTDSHNAIWSADGKTIYRGYWNLWSETLMYLENPPAKQAKSTSVKINVNGFDVSPNVSPVNIAGKIYVNPAEFLKTLRALYVFDKTTQTIVAVKGETTVVMNIGSNSAEVNGIKVKLGDAPIVMNGSPMIPAAPVAQSLGAGIQWNAKIKTLNVTTPVVSNRYSSDQLSWGLAVDAILTKTNRQRFDLLGGGIPGKRMTESTKDMLSIWWGINNRNDAFDTISWLKGTGHRADYEVLAGLVAMTPDEEFDKQLEKYKDNTEFVRQVKFVKEHYKELGSKSLTGWDWIRLVNVVRDCYLAGYLTKEEAWEEIMFAARTLQQTFDSWEDMGNNYVLGAQFWSPEDYYKDRADTVQWLLSDAGSPWTLIKWDLSLKPTGAQRR